MKKLLVIALSILATGQLLAQDLTIDEIISKNLSVIGQDKLMKVQTIKTTGKMTQSGMEFNIIQYQKNPDLARQEIEIQGMSIIVAINGETGWTINPMTGSMDAQDLPPETIKSLLEESQSDPVVNWDNPFYKWKEKGIKVEHDGKQDLDGTPVYNLKFIFNSGNIYNFVVDADKFVILKELSTKTEQGQTYEQETRYSDFTEVEGVQFPVKTEVLVNGQVAIVIILDKVEFDVPIDDSIFEKPVQ